MSNAGRPAVSVPGTVRSGCVVKLEEVRVVLARCIEVHTRVRELVVVVFDCHEELAVVFSVFANFCFELCCPLVGVLGPVAME